MKVRHLDFAAAAAVSAPRQLRSYFLGCMNLHDVLENGFFCTG